MFNSRLTALVEDADHRIGAEVGWGRMIMQGDSIDVYKLAAYSAKAACQIDFVAI